MGMAGHVPLSESSRSEAEGPSPPARNAPGRVGSGGFRGRKMMGAGHSIDENVRPPFDEPRLSECVPSAPFIGLQVGFAIRSDAYDDDDHGSFLENRLVYHSDSKVPELDLA